MFPVTPRKDKTPAFTGSGTKAYRPHLSAATVLAALLAAPAGALVGKAAEPPGPALSPEGIEFFEKRVRPLLATKCFACHSERSGKEAGGLRLDTRAALLKGGNSGPALLPGDPGKSLLLHAVRHQEGTAKMPPGGKLPDAQIRDLEAWVKMGAPWPEGGGKGPGEREKGQLTIDNSQLSIVNSVRTHWSFRPLQMPAVPQVKDRNWAKTPIDAFVLAGLEKQGLKPGPEADRRTLIRRVTFDLTGLPPTPEEVDAFLVDRSPQAWEKVVDRLLASPHYGEAWGRHWLDLARYADTSGCNSDFPVPEAYRYRNWVIRSFNQDKPYDRFLQEQLAGDLLPAASDGERYEQIIATGYLATARRFGSLADEFHLTIEDILDNAGKSMLGLSLGCARCHDHKFDPISQKEYYALYGIFASTKFAFPGTEIPPERKDFVPLAPPTQVKAWEEWERSFAAARKQTGELERKVKQLEKDPKQSEALATARAGLAAAKNRVRELEAQPVRIDLAYAVQEGKPGNARLQRKGDPKNPGDEVPRGFLKVLGGQTLPPGATGSGRLELARWITDPANPLTARVMVNRIWQGHFGRGIVQTPNDFGTRGKAPTHPELLDYLAVKFVRSGWSIKAMHREILLSRTYRLASVDVPQNAARDPNNEWLWRYNRRRLPAEAIRDGMLAVSGALDRTMGGEHPFPPQPFKYTQHRPFYADYPTNRRSIYLMQQRIRKQPYLELFDGADPNAPTAERPISNTSIQALYMLNDPFVHEQGQRFAERVLAAAPETDARIRIAYRLAFGRSPEAEEIALGQEHLAAGRRALQTMNLTADQQERKAWASYLRVLLTSSEFLFLE